jgi:hypothetical protein
MSVKIKRFLSIVLLIALSLTVYSLSSFWTINKNGVREFYVGITFSSKTTTEARLLIDKVKSYTNLLIVNSGPVSKNETALNEICDYAVSADLHIIVYFGIFDHQWQLAWLDTAKQRYGDKFLGLYFFDEPAGGILDHNYPAGSLIDLEYKTLQANPPKSYDEMADLFINSWRTMPGLISAKTIRNPPVAFTSDYALYWFDYLAGYDVVLAQFGWNHSREQDIALIRGASRVQNKEWGVIVTWTFSNSPYLETGKQLHDDMIMAYENGAKYIIVFNYPRINDYGVLKQEHFDALEKFWHEIHTGSQQAPCSAKTVLVLPKNYGWGMRSVNDTIWSFWGPDEKSAQVWNTTRALLERYPFQIDIVYDDVRFPLEDKYTKVYYWNSTL